MLLEGEAKIFWCLSQQIRECLETGEVPVAEFLDEIDTAKLYVENPVVLDRLEMLRVDLTKTPMMGVA
jgi:hypothetical protein